MFGDACEKPVMGMLALDFHPAVGDEVAEAIGWYRERSEAAADDFIVSLDEALNQIVADPERAALYMHGRRAVRVGKFPYVVIYRPHELSVRISAVAHTSRRPATGGIDNFEGHSGLHRGRLGLRTKLAGRWRAAQRSTGPVAVMCWMR